MLWLALYIPHLPLAVFQRAGGEQPFAVTEQQTVLAANAAARAVGIGPGMKLGAAQALSSTLRLRPRQPKAEAQALRRLAGWSLQFTPLVSLQPPAGLLLEIGGSLNLFKGLPALLTRVRQGLEELGYTAALAVAPTPSGAWLLCRGGDEEPVTELPELRERLAALPIDTLDLEPQQALALEGLGLSTLGDCLALPRAGLARRLGSGLLPRLDRALGKTPEPRRPYLSPPRFESSLELPAEVEHTEPLLFALRRLLSELCGFLLGLDSGVQRLELELEHAGPPTTVIGLGMVEPSRDAARLLSLTRERLERIELRAPVRTLRLHADDIRLLSPVPGELLIDGRPRHLWSHLVERLYARLGEEAVRGLTVCSEHRPERAWRYVAPGEASAAEDHGERPLWLLPSPQPLRLAGGRPCWRGPLVLQRGPERIETGWWDGRDVSRDYYIAHNPEGARLWIFRERRGGRGWFLHGIFG